MKPSSQATNFEAVKISMRQSKDGLVVSFAVHPNDMDAGFFCAPTGTRYMIAAVELNDQDRPVGIVRDSMRVATDIVAYAGQLCREPKFQAWMYTKGFAAKPTEGDTVAGLIHQCGIMSRHELADDQEAAAEFHAVAARYLEEAA